MKSCPNCGEILGTHADSCFKCRYDFTIGRVLSREDLDKKQEIIDEQMRIRKEREEKQREREEQIKREKLDFIQKLPMYEYATEVIYDKRSGGADIITLSETLARYARDGWRLHTAFTNEAGKNATTVGLGSVSLGTNATMDQTILIFERMISKGTL